MNGKSFTLIELIVVLLIIGILAVLAIPQYMRAVERARVGKGKVMLGLIIKANKLNIAQTGSYTSDLPTLHNYIEVVASDADWSYTANAGDGSATAIRTGGDQISKTITLSQAGIWTGDHSMK
jgi:prepilin-type N-terminal cleavage/methylation domain-containing protein